MIRLVAMYYRHLQTRSYRSTFIAPLISKSFFFLSTRFSGQLTRMFVGWLNPPQLLRPITPTAAEPFTALISE